jgi:hypothetical protein
MLSRGRPLAVVNTCGESRIEINAFCVMIRVRASSLMSTVTHAVDGERGALTHQSAISSPKKRACIITQKLETDLLRCLSGILVQLLAGFVARHVAWLRCDDGFLFASVFVCFFWIA